MEPQASTPPSVTPQRPPTPRSTVVICVLAGAMGMFMCIHAIASGMRQLRDDEREEILDIDERSPAELEAEHLLRETERLQAEKALLQREVRDEQERLAGLTARAPAMPPIATWVATVDERVVGLACGSDEKIEKGFQFSITRDKKFIARVVVAAVGEKACACRILMVKDGEKIQVGDDAATKLN